MAAKQKILIIDDDNNIAELISLYLTKECFETRIVNDGEQALKEFQIFQPDLLLLDLMLPGMNGEALLPQIKAGQNVPVIVVSAKDSIDSKVGLLTSGAEDYLTKPFDIQEFIARVGVQIRRFAGKGEKSPDGHSDVLSYRELELHTDSYTASVGGQPVELTRQEFKILELLLLHPNKVFSKQDIYDYAWDDIYIGEDKTINVHISNIRKKLKAVTDEEYIETVWGIGFRLKKQL